MALLVVRTRLTVVVAAVVLVAAAGVVWAWTADDDDQPTEPARAGFATRTVKAGEVDVKITPRRIDDAGATFEVVFDTHSVELDVDLPSVARLTVNGTAWPPDSWTGDGPGGHHREGELNFSAGGSPAGEAVLEIDGLPAAVRATWRLAS